MDQPMAFTASMSLDATELANHTLMRSCVLGIRSYTSIIFAIIYLPLISVTFVARTLTSYSRLDQRAPSSRENLSM
jgi:hypothetical protein